MALKKTVDKWKLKKWFSVYAPKAFNDAMIGEMPANDEKVVVGRTIRVSLSNLTHNPSHAYTNVVLKVTDVEGSSAHTRLVSIEQLYSYIKSLVRRYRSVATSVVPVLTKDGKRLVVKLLAITRQRTAHTKIVGIRSEMRKLTEDYFKEIDSGEAIAAVVEGKFQAALASKLNHIASLNKVEVKKLEIAQE